MNLFSRNSRKVIFFGTPCINLNISWLYNDIWNILSFPIRMRLEYQRMNLTTYRASFRWEKYKKKTFSTFATNCNHPPHPLLWNSDWWHSFYRIYFMKIKELSQRDTGIDVRYIWRNRIRLTNTISQSFSVWITQILQ